MKAVVIVDVPDDIADAYENLTVDYFLYGEPIEYDESFKENVIYVEDVKLKPLPETKDIGYPNDNYDVGFADGWDACLKELIK